jgi:toluene monooxygenase system protein E
MQKTYWHLCKTQKLPSTYEISTSRLLYHPAQGLEVDTPVKKWYSRYKNDIPLEVIEQFRDPNEMTYIKYVRSRSTQTQFTEIIFGLIQNESLNQNSPCEWQAQLDKIIPVLRFPLHGMQMVACYLAQMTPTSRLTIPFMFQAADEMAWIQMLAYRMKQLQINYPNFGENAKFNWQSEACWQSLRKTVEFLLVTFDWLNAFAGLNLVLKPLISDFFITKLSQLAHDSKDHHWVDLLSVIKENYLEHQRVSNSLTKHLEENFAPAFFQLNQMRTNWQKQIEDFGLKEDFEKILHP